MIDTVFTARSDARFSIATIDVQPVGADTFFLFVEALRAENQKRRFAQHPAFTSWQGTLCQFEGTDYRALRDKALISFLSLRFRWRLIKTKKGRPVITFCDPPAKLVTLVRGTNWSEFLPSRFESWQGGAS